jgi:predicted nucleotidyltransferase
LKEPCIHALEALRSLVDERESRGLGIPMEARITRVLADVRDRIWIAFIFGSMARGDQDPESDIDLMVIGQVSLKELSPCLKRAEQELGRQVNTVIYSESEWAKRREERNPFVARVLKGDKIFVIGGHDELAAMA